MESFLLHGTLPIPPGVFPRPDGQQPFGVVDVSGETYGAQAEVTSWYANDEVDGADVVEIIARVSRGSQAVGSRATYRIVLATHASQPSPGTPGVEDLQNGPTAVPTSIKNLVGNPANLEFISYDCFDNKYTMQPLDGGAEKNALMRYGEHTAELRSFQHLMPAPAVSGGSGTLHHWLGVHTYARTFSGEEMLGLDIRVSNADSGVDPSTDIDNPLDKLYFKNFQLAVPNGWVVVQDYKDPMFGNGDVKGGSTIFPIVKGISGGSDMHVMEWGGQFHRRLMICKVGDEDRAKDLLQGAGLGFSRLGMDPEEGHEYWSWWNDNTARYWPQRHLIPIFDHVGFSSVVNGIKSERSDLKSHILNGTSKGGYPIEVGNLGYAHPYGVGYGGMTGGAEINIFDGMQTVWAAEVAGYQKFRMIHRMHSDRMPNALFNSDGDPSSAEDWMKVGGSGEYVPFSHFIIPNLSGADAFGVHEAEQFQIDHVSSNGMKPDYENTLLGFDAHDYQHFSRYTRAAKVLSWIANDSLAQDDLCMQAENFKFSWHQYYNSSGGYVQVSGLRWDLDYVDEHFGAGLRVGRGEGWGLDCTNAAYSCADAEWREGRREWYDIVSQMMFDGQGACNGFMQSNIQEKFLDAKYRARQAIEHAILDNGLRGMLESVYRGDDVAHTAMMEDVLEDSFYALISDMSWGPGEPAPWQYAAVGPLDESQPIWCSLSQLPSDGYTPGAYDAFQNWSEFAYAHDLTGAQIFLNKAGDLMGGTSNLLAALENDKLNNIANRAGLLAYMQHLNGDF
ncbi:MAG: hypothetical protein AAF682_09725 [Planctomycetota bacterium]